MKDTIIKGNGKSRNIKAPVDMPETFEGWRTQLLAGSATLDIGLNADGCEVVGTAMSKANLLSDNTKNALWLTGSDPTVNDALYTLSQKTCSAEIRVYGDVGTTVTMSRNGKILTGTVTSVGYATLYPVDLGDWTVVLTYGGTQKTQVYTLEVIGIDYVYPIANYSTLEDTTWEDISIISRFGLSDKAGWKIGDQKNILIDGTTYAVQIIDFDHDDLTEEDNNRTKAGITFQLVDCPSGKYSMNTTGTNSGGWKDSSMRTNTLVTLRDKLPSDLKNVLKSVNKVTSIGTMLSSLETTSDQLFLLSEIEVFGTTASSFAGEGQQYAYYSAGNSKVKKIDGSAFYWWLRSPYIMASKAFCCVNDLGTLKDMTATYSCGASFAFCV